jgi:glycerol uptake facilitator-like aquaporin
MCTRPAAYLDISKRDYWAGAPRSACEHNEGNSWLYVLAPIVGAVIAASVYAGLNRPAREQKTAAAPVSAAG